MLFTLKIRIKAVAGAGSRFKGIWDGRQRGKFRFPLCRLPLDAMALLKTGRFAIARFSRNSSGGGSLDRLWGTEKPGILGYGLGARGYGLWALGFGLWTGMHRDAVLVSRSLAELDEDQFRYRL